MIQKDILTYVVDTEDLGNIKTQKSSFFSESNERHYELTKWFSAVLTTKGS